MNAPFEISSKIPAVDKTVQVIDAIIANGPCSVVRIIESTGIPRSTAYTLVSEMERLGLIAEDLDGNYELGLKLIAIGAAALRSLPLPQAVKPYLERLLDVTPSIAAYFGTMSGGHGNFIAKVESPQRSHITAKSQVGQTTDPVHSGMGKCLFAYQDPEIIREQLPCLDYTPITPSSLADQETLERDLIGIRERGYALNDSEDDPLIRSLAAPVFNARGELLGAFSVVGTLASFDYENLSLVADQLKGVAAEMSAQLR